MEGAYGLGVCLFIFSIVGFIIIFTLNKDIGMGEGFFMSFLLMFLMVCGIAMIADGPEEEESTYQVIIITTY